MKKVKQILTKAYAMNAGTALISKKDKIWKKLLVLFHRVLDKMGRNISTYSRVNGGYKREFLHYFIGKQLDYNDTCCTWCLIVTFVFRFSCWLLLFASTPPVWHYCMD